MSAAAVHCDDPATLVLTARLAPAGLELTGLALAFAIAIGAVAVPDLPGALADATRSLDAWIYPAIAGLIFLESSLPLSSFEKFEDPAHELSSIAGQASLPCPPRLELITPICISTTGEDARRVPGTGHGS